jgi:hypothetical protein
MFQDSGHHSQSRAVTDRPSGSPGRHEHAPRRAITYPQNSRSENTVRFETPRRSEAAHPSDRAGSSGQHHQHGDTRYTGHSRNHRNNDRTQESDNWSMIVNTGGRRA